METLLKFAAVHNHFNLDRPLVERQSYKERHSAAWQALALKDPSASFREHFALD
jgi:hypothetical protein